MTFGIGTVSFTELYSSTARTIVSGPNAAATTFNISHLPSDAVVAKKYGAAVNELKADGANATLVSGKSYVIRDVVTTGANAVKSEIDMSETNDPSAKSVGDLLASNSNSLKDKDGSAKNNSGDFAAGDHLVVGSANITVTQASTGAGLGKSVNFAEVRTDDNAFVKGETYVIYSLGDSDGNTGTAGSDAAFIKAASTNVDGTAISGTLAVGQKFTVSSSASTEAMAALNSLIDDMEFTKASDTLTKDIEAVQAKLNTARVQAGSQYAALESAVAYTTDLTAQYELGYNTVNDVNFSMETAHLAKNQILQQAATAMLAQANSGQQGLLQLIQG